MTNRDALFAWSLSAVFTAACGVFLAGIATNGEWWALAANAVAWLATGVSIGGVLTMRDVLAGKFRR